jgi:hypothetical protein
MYTVFFFHVAIVGGVGTVRVFSTDNSVYSSKMKVVVALVLAFVVAAEALPQQIVQTQG